MKKLVSILGGLTLITSSATTVNACGNPGGSDVTPDQDRINDILSKLSESVLSHIKQISDDYKSGGATTLDNLFNVGKDKQEEIYNQWSDASKGFLATWDKKEINSDDEESGAADYIDYFQDFVQKSLIENIKNDFHKNNAQDWNYLFSTVGDDFLKLDIKKSKITKDEFHWNPSDPKHNDYGFRDYDQAFKDFGKFDWSQISSNLYFTITYKAPGNKNNMISSTNANLTWSICKNDKEKDSIKQFWDATTRKFDSAVSKYLNNTAPLKIADQYVQDKTHSVFNPLISDSYRRSYSKNINNVLESWIKNEATSQNDDSTLWDGATVIDKTSDKIQNIINKDSSNIFQYLNTNQEAQKKLINLMIQWSQHKYYGKLDDWTKIWSDTLVNLETTWLTDKNSTYNNLKEDKTAETVGGLDINYLKLKNGLIINLNVKANFSVYYENNKDPKKPVQINREDNLKLIAKYFSTVTWGKDKNSAPLFAMIKTTDKDKKDTYRLMVHSNENTKQLSFKDIGTKLVSAAKHSQDWYSNANHDFGIFWRDVAKEPDWSNAVFKDIIAQNNIKFSVEDTNYESWLNPDNKKVANHSYPGLRIDGLQITSPKGIFGYFYK